MRDAEVRTAILRLKSDWAALGMRVALLKLIFLETRAYHPEQPRDELGRWTPFGGFGLAHRQPHAEGVQVAQGGRGVPRLPGMARIRINGQEFEATIPQQIRLEAATAASTSVIATVRQIDPSYRPRASAYEPGVEGEIAARLGEAQEAAARLRELRRSPYQADTLDDLIYRDGQPIGYRFAGANEKIRTVPKEEFDEIVGKILCDPRVERVPSISPTYQGMSYRLRDGSIVGLRLSQDNGLTLDVQQPAWLFYNGPIRIHQQ